MSKQFNRNLLLVLSAVAAIACWFGANAEKVAAKEPVKIIFDTDVGNDIDDVLAMAILHNLESRGECDLLAVTITKDNQYAAPFTKMINSFYGRPDIPVGMVQESGVETFDGAYLKQTLEEKNENGELKFPVQDATKDVSDAVRLLRKTLAENDDQSVVIVQVGFSTNLARLLDSKADEFSPLDGKELAARKVKFASVMAGSFSDDLKGYAEYNVVKDVPSAQKFFAEWPTPIFVSGFEIGREILMPGTSMANDYEYVANHPVKESYRFYRGLENDQCTWDLTSVLFAVRQDRGYFDLSDKGTVVVRDDASTWFEASENGNVRYLTATPEQRLRVQEAFVWICSEMQAK